MEGVSRYVAIFTGEILCHWIQYTTERCDSMEQNYIQYFPMFKTKKFPDCKGICLSQLPTLNMVEFLGHCQTDCEYFRLQNLPHK